MHILLLGSGGREHALARKIAQSDKTTQLYIAPGNPGTAQLGTNVDLSPNDFRSVAEFALFHQVDLIVVGPEDPLVGGLHDYIASREDCQHIGVIGPRAAAARLEGSKEFAKNFMLRHGIPTAKHFTVTPENVAEGEAFLASLQAPYVLKADGLCAGKGVLILPTLHEAQNALREMLGGMFKKASAHVVIEEFLQGIECSVFVLTDGKDYKLLPVAKDYKRIGEGDTGLNTGGMGSISPVCFADEAFMSEVESRIIRPTIQGLQADGIDYQGFIFFGLIKTSNGPMVIEYNVRMGDPETESVLLRLKSDLVELFQGVVQRNLASCNIEISDEAAVSVILVSGGYPEHYTKGLPISGLVEALQSGVTIFHAGTTEQAGRLLTNGGRVLSVSCTASTVAEALQKCYAAADKISYEGIYFRRDIGFDLLSPAT